MFFEKIDKILKSLFSLASVGRAGNDVVHIKRKYQVSIEHLGTSTIHNVASNLVDNGRFANTSFASKNYIPFGSLHHRLPDFFALLISSENCTVAVLLKPFVQPAQATVQRIRNIRKFSIDHNAINILILEFFCISTGFFEELIHVYR